MSNILIKNVSIAADLTDKGAVPGTGGVDLRIADGKIVERAGELTPAADEAKIIDLNVSLWQ